MKSKGRKLDLIYNDGVLDFQLIFHVFSSGGDNCGRLTYHTALEESSEYNSRTPHILKQVSQEIGMFLGFTHMYSLRVRLLKSEHNLTPRWSVDKKHYFIGLLSHN